MKKRVFLLVAAVLFLGGAAAVFDNSALTWNMVDPVERGDPLPPGPLGDPLPPGPLGDPLPPGPLGDPLPPGPL